MKKYISIIKICFIVIVISSAYTNGGIITGPVTNPANGHSYYLLDTDGYKWWLQAEAEAVLLGGHLVTINDAAENQWVLDTFSTDAVNYADAHSLPDAGNISFWLGYNRYQQGNNWTWVSGESSQYTNWHPSQPTMLAGEDFAGMLVNWWQPGMWHDIIDDSEAADLPFGVVEVIPEPATICMLGLGALSLLRRKK